MSETPVTRPARQKLSFTLAEEESMVAKTVAVDPHLSGGSEELGKVPPPQVRNDAAKNHMGRTYREKL